jgi:hypothetical protein
MVELIHKKGVQRILPWQNALFYSSIGALILAGSLYALFLYLETSRSTDLKEVNLQITSVGTIEERKVEKEVFQTKNKIEDFSKMLDSRDKSSQVLTFMELIAHPSIWFSNFSLSVEEGTLSLSGETGNFKNLGEQISILRSNNMIESVDISEIAIGKEGQVVFGLTLTLNKEVMK